MAPKMKNNQEVEICANLGSNLGRTQRQEEAGGVVAPKMKNGLIPSQRKVPVDSFVRTHGERSVTPPYS